MWLALGRTPDRLAACCGLRQAWFLLQGHRLLQELLPVYGSVLQAQQHLKALLQCES